MEDIELNRHSPLCDVLNCMLEQIEWLAGNEYIYGDGDKICILTEEVKVIINLLSHSKVSAVEIFDMAELTQTLATQLEEFGINLNTSGG